MNISLRADTEVLSRPGRYRGRVVWPDPKIVCVDCGGTARPLGWFPEDGELEVGTVLPYRCIDCWDRWDVVVGSGEDENPGADY